MPSASSWWRTVVVTVLCLELIAYVVQVSSATWPVPVDFLPATHRVQARIEPVPSCHWPATHLRGGDGEEGKVKIWEDRRRAAQSPGLRRHCSSEQVDTYAVHSVCPGAFWYWPAEHSTQSVTAFAPALGLALPAQQLKGNVGERLGGDRRVVRRRRPAGQRIFFPATDRLQLT
jgi:hypothetical protein